MERAKTIDPRVPPWIYSAIENKQDNRINEGVRDLGIAGLNDNRRVYRSKFLLDRTRGPKLNLAAIYQADGMEVSVREAKWMPDYSTASPICSWRTTQRPPRRSGSTFVTRRPGSTSCSWRTCFHQSAAVPCRNMFGAGILEAIRGDRFGISSPHLLQHR
jgi:hypothetical protein